MHIIFTLLTIIGSVGFFYYWIICKLLIWIFEPILNTEEKKEDQPDEHLYNRFEDQYKTVEYEKKVYLKGISKKMNEYLKKRIEI